ncbi:DUF2197 domain-containing protein [Kroppenstedtia guangzhouensis]|uniref:DUF2197 domain-containing protein n=1 Tax=Kroppenstedtia guangzhouensis TaxID=1274356 RepID=UPI0035710BF8
MFVMKIVCVLCDRPFTADTSQEKKLRKHPYRIFLCPDCHQRIAHRTLARQEHGEKRVHSPLDCPPGG